MQLFHSQSWQNEDTVTSFHTQHSHLCTKDLVYMVMAKVDPRGLEERGGVGKAR